MQRVLVDLICCQHQLGSDCRLWSLFAISTKKPFSFMHAHLGRTSDNNKQHFCCLNPTKPVYGPIKTMFISQLLKVPMLTRSTVQQQHVHMIKYVYLRSTPHRSRSALFLLHKLHCSTVCFCELISELIESISAKYIKICTMTNCQRQSVKELLVV